MKIPETPITELATSATLAEVIDKVNEVIRALNGMWNPDDGTP